MYGTATDIVWNADLHLLTRRQCQINAPIHQASLMINECKFYFSIILGELYTTILIYFYKFYFLSDIYYWFSLIRKKGYHSLFLCRLYIWKKLRKSDERLWQYLAHHEHKVRRRSFYCHPCTYTMYKKNVIYLFYWTVIQTSTSRPNIQDRMFLSAEYIAHNRYFSLRILTV